MFIEPATPIRPSKVSPACSATFELPPSAPIRYFERTVISLPVNRSRHVVVTPSPSCTWLTYSVDIRAWVPREQAVLNRSGSMKVWGRSFIWLGEDSWCSARETGCLPQLFMRPISSPASEVQKTFSPIRSCSAANI
ncbi:hypothetical protein D9M72_437690 [compost metagenome]